jgi:hypothetical protein
MVVLANDTTTDALYEVVGSFSQNFPALVDLGATALWVPAPSTFMLTPAIAPGIRKVELDRLLQHTVDQFRVLGLDTSYTSTEYPTFLDAYISVSSSWNVSDYNLGGRLIPRDVVANQTDAVVRALKYIS